MITFISILILFSAFVINRFLFHRFINHLMVYTISWVGFAILYDLRLINYSEISLYTWVIILMTYLCFVLGIVTVFIARKSLKKNNSLLTEPVNIEISLFKDDGQVLKLYIYVISAIGFFAAFHHWHELISKFGSITKVLLNANTIYSMRVSGEYSGSLPYLYTISYAGVFLGAYYTAYKEKLTLVAVLPIIAVILKDMASVGRAGILFAFLMFFLTFFTAKYALGRNIANQSKKNSRKLIIAALTVVLLSVLSVVAVKAVRGQVENYNATTRSLNKLKSSVFITPSIYLYFSSNQVVLSRYFFSEDEQVMFGENTFLTLYNFLSKFNVVEHPRFYPKGYYIPMWTNQATYLREIHADFGYFGLFFVPYFIGLITTFFWFRYLETYNVRYLVAHAFFNIIVAFSIFIVISRMAAWSIALLFLLFTLPYVERLSIFNANRILKKHKLNTNT
jgi:oligosaccharide repeat unit polymerase